jgi:hypothetical protein
VICVSVERNLSGPDDSDAMNEMLDIELDALFLEIARYLAAVDAFRAAACEPTWLPEQAATSAGTPGPPARGGARRARA